LLETLFIIDFRSPTNRQGPAPLWCWAIVFSRMVATELSLALWPESWPFLLMQDMKDTRRAWVRIGYDGRVHKTFRGHQAKERFQNELRVLRYLESRACASVPRVLEAHEDELRLVTTNCGRRIERIAETRVRELFADLETQYQVRHEDPYARNVTYSTEAGSLCLIDFEFATILDPTVPPGPVLDLPEPDGPRGD
jgi:hypothetical protein